MSAAFTIAGLLILVASIGRALWMQAEQGDITFPTRVLICGIGGFGTVLTIIGALLPS